MLLLKVLTKNKSEDQNIFKTCLTKELPQGEVPDKLTFEVVLKKILHEDSLNEFKKAFHPRLYLKYGEDSEF